MAYIELQLRVEGDGRVHAVEQRGGEVYGKFNLSPLHRDLIAIFDLWLREKKITRRRELEGFGSLLYHSLFEGEVDTFFRQRLAAVSGDDRLRLQLVFQQDAIDLASVPWEFLYSPDSASRKGFFLATDPKLVLSRYLPRDVDREELRTSESPLRFLVVTSQPKPLNPVLGPPVVEEIQKLQTNKPIAVETLENPTIDSFLDAIERVQPHVLHFMGHGRYEQNEGAIALLQYDGETPEWVSDRTFAEYFQRTQPRLVVLHACQGGAVNLTNNFAGVAPQLIRMGVPAVVAMQYPVTNIAAINFSRTFYQELARDHPVDGAAQEGRRWVTMRDPQAYSTRDFGTPVLYMRSRDGLIMPQSEPPAGLS